MGTHPIFESDFDCLTDMSSEKTMFVATLVEMGFDQKLSEVALAKVNNSSVQNAMDWILANPDYEIGAESQVIKGEETPTTPKVAQTPEERAASAAALQERLNKARDLRIQKEKEEKLQKEIERREQGKQITSTKDTYEQIQMKRAAEERRREKEQAKKDKERVRAQIAEDKERRKRAAESAKNATSAEAVAATSTATQPHIQPRPKVQATNTRLQIRFPDGSRRVQVFEADDELKKVNQFVSGQFEGDFDLVSGGPPPKKLTPDDQGKTLDELSLCPSAVIMVQKK